MKCIDIRELEQFIMGRLHAQRLVEIDEHVRACAECRAALCALPARKRLGIDIGAALLESYECPQYEELSEYVDGSLTAESRAAMASHVNLCELCSRDVARMSEMRSHAAMRERVTVRPTGRPENTVARFPAWKQVLAGLSVAALAAVIAISFGRIGPAPKAPVTVAKAPAIKAPPMKQPMVPPDKHVAKVPSAPPATSPGNSTVAQAPTMQPVAPVKPAYETLLRDGSYRVIRRNGRLEMAKIDGTLVRTELEARIAASIDQKLRTGRIRPAKTVQMAMATIETRGAAFTPPATAPTLASPVGKILMSDMPRFSWSKVELADSYRIRIFDEKGQVILEKTTQGNSLTPSTPLPRGVILTWRVGVRFSESDAWAESAAAKFKVLSAEDFETIQRTERLMPNSHLALGVAYESFGLRDEAAREYRALLKSNPHSSLARKLLH
ncbi:MAG: hypothetical protein M1133_10265 [Armatimonadetes bacterium]|nr:hypothetical protein [Armatimonadota bacterium]